MSKLRYSRFKTMPLVLSIVGGIVIAIIAYTAYWFLAADEIGERIVGWAEGQRARGMIIETGEPEVGGYPLQFEVFLRQPSIDHSSGGWAWQGEGITVSFHPWKFNEFDLKFRGRNDIRYFDGEIWHDIHGVVEDGTAWLRLNDQRRIENVQVNLSQVDVGGLWGEGLASVRQFRARAERFGGYDEGERANASAFGSVGVELESVELPPGFGEEMGEEIEFLNFDFSLYGPIPSGDTAQAVRVWRDEGGTLELNSFRVRWGPLGIETNGTISLDGEMRPIAALTADIIGYGDVIDALIMSNMIPLGDAFLAKVAFNVIADKPDDGGPPVLRSVPVTAQDGGLFVGPVTVAKIPSLNF